MGALSLGLATLSSCPRPAPNNARAARVSARSRNATTEIARRIVGGRCGALIHVDRARKGPGASKLDRLGHWGTLLSGTGVDPIEGVSRAFVTAKKLDDLSTCALVLDLAVDAQRTRELMASLGANGGDGAIDMELDGEPYLVGRIAPRTIAAVPAERADAWHLFAGSQGLPGPEGDEAISAFADDPRETLTASAGWPATVVDARVDIELSRWGMTLDLVARSISAEQAELDAAALSEALRRALALDLVLFEMDLLDPIAFVARGEAIEMSVRFGRAEAELLFALGRLG